MFDMVVILNRATVVNTKCMPLVSEGIWTLAFENPWNCSDFEEVIILFLFLWGKLAFFCNKLLTCYHCLFLETKIEKMLLDVKFTWGEFCC